MRKRWYVLIVLGLLACLAGAFLLGKGFKSSSEKQAAHVARGVESNVERKAALINYTNALEACETRGNESRENQLILATALAAAQRPELSEPGQRVVDRLTHAEHARPDGTIECSKAIRKP